MKKVAIINSVYEYGSTGALTKKLYEYGNQHGYECFVFYGRGKRVSEKNITRIESPFAVYLHKLLTLLTGRQGFFSNLGTKRMLSRIKSEKIRYVILLNLHGYYLNEKKLLDFLKRNKIQTAYVTPDEYAGLGKCCYNKGCDKYKTECSNCPLKRDYPKSIFFDCSNLIFHRKKESYTGFDTLTILGPETNLVKFRESALIKDKPMRRVSWGVDLDLYRYSIDNSIYNKYGIPYDKTIILTVARYSDDRKGVKEYFFEIARELQGTQYHFINVGYDGNLQPEDMPVNMTTISYMDNQKELAQLYSLADLYLLASSTDTMPLSCLISFACETPVCCFYTSGLKYLAPRDSLAVKYCDEKTIEALINVVKSTNKKESSVMKACRELAQEEYSVDAFSRSVFRVFEGE